MIKQTNEQRLGAALLAVAMLTLGVGALILMGLHASLPAGVRLVPLTAITYGLVGIVLLIQCADGRGYVGTAKFLFYGFSALALTGIVTGSGNPGLAAAGHGYWLTYVHALIGMAGAAIGWPKNQPVDTPDLTPGALPTFGEYQDQTPRHH